MKYRSRGGCLMLSAFVLLGCASLRSAQHIGTVTAAAVHGTLDVVKDSEALLVCGRPSAPPAGQCVTDPTHLKILQILYTAFDLHEKAAQVIHDLPVGAPQPDEVVKELAEIGDLVKSILALIPESEQKASLSASVKGGK